MVRNRGLNRLRQCQTIVENERLVTKKMTKIRISMTTFGFGFFENKRDAKSKKMILRPLDSASTPKQHSSKALR